MLLPCGAPLLRASTCGRPPARRGGAVGPGGRGAGWGAANTPARTVGGTRPGVWVATRAGWYFAYGESMNPFWLEKLEIYPQDWAGAIVVRRKLTFSTPGIDPECYEPAWANLEPGVKGDMAHGVLLSLEDEDLAKLDQAWAPRGAERATIKTMAYDRRSLEAVAHVVPDERAARGLRPSARHLEVLLEAARLRSLDPKWIYHLEAEVPSPLYTPPPVGEGTRVLMPEEVREANGRDSARQWVAVRGRVFDVATDGGLAAGVTPEQLGTDIAVPLVTRLYLPDLGSRNPLHWPSSPTELEMGKLLAPDPSDRKATSREGDALVGWACFFARRYPTVGIVAYQEAEEE